MYSMTFRVLKTRTDPIRQNKMLHYTAHTLISQMPPILYASQATVLALIPCFSPIAYPQFQRSKGAISRSNRMSPSFDQITDNTFLGIGNFCSQLVLKLGGSELRELWSLKSYVPICPKMGHFWRFFRFFRVNPKIWAGVVSQFFVQFSMPYNLAAITQKRLGHANGGVISQNWSRLYYAFAT